MPASIACTCVVTSHEPYPATLVDVAALPVVAGWFVQVTVASAQVAATCKA